MSSNLYWEPAHRKKTHLPDALKFVLQKRCGSPVNDTLNDGDLSYLRGLRDAGIPGAEELIEAIEKHGSVVVIEHF